VSDPLVNAETIQTLARLQGIEIEAAHLEPLAAALTAHLAAVAALHDYYDVTEVEPALTFDPLW
jgi:hypothetical protein